MDMKHKCLFILIVAMIMIITVPSFAGEEKLVGINYYGLDIGWDSNYDVLYDTSNGFIIRPYGRENRDSNNIFR